MKQRFIIFFVCLFGCIESIFADVLHFENVAEMVRSTKLTKGDIVMTKGFYEPNDGGGASYNIICEPTTAAKYPADGWSLIKLNQPGLFADILLTGDEVSLCQLGAIPVAKMGANPDATRKMKNFRDCHDNLIAYIHLCQRRNHVFQLNCPAGHFFTSPAYLVIGNNKGVRIRGAAPKDYGNTDTTVFHAMQDRQEYIWTLSGAEHICHKDYPFVQTSGVNVTNITFNGKYAGGTKPQYQVSPLAAIIAVGMCNSNFDALNFVSIGGSAMVLCNTQETVFQFVSLVACGAFYKGRVMPCIWYTGMMGDKGFAKKILGRTDQDYAPYKSTRNCSANYYHYINAEGISGSIIHSDRSAVFTHSEIGNIQWEGSFCDFGNVENQAYDFIKHDGRTDYSFAENIHAETHPHEKVVLCGAFSGWGHDVTIHAITHTWNPMGYAVWSDSTMYRIRKAAAVVMNEEDTDGYSNIHLIDYNWRQEFPACWISVKPGLKMHARAFSLDTPLPPSTNVIRCFNGTMTPCLNFAGNKTQDIIYPATENQAFNCCHFDPEALAPAHLVAYSPYKNGRFGFNYRVNKHYIARVKPKSLDLNKQKEPIVSILLTFVRNGQEQSQKIQCPVFSFEEFSNIDLPLDQLAIDDNTTVQIAMGGLAETSLLAWDCIYVMDNYPVYADQAPVSDCNWCGRLWQNQQSGQLFHCSSLSHPALYKIECRKSPSLLEEIANKLKAQHFAACLSKGVLYCWERKDCDLRQIIATNPAEIIATTEIQESCTETIWEPNQAQ